MVFVFAYAFGSRIDSKFTQKSLRQNHRLMYFQNDNLILFSGNFKFYFGFISMSKVNFSFICA
jgi:hypothetical protein